jgi:hypothetical protein
MWETLLELVLGWFRGTPAWDYVLPVLVVLLVATLLVLLVWAAAIHQ